MSEVPLYNPVNFGAGNFWQDRVAISAWSCQLPPYSERLTLSAAGAKSSVEELKALVRTLVDEFFDSGDLAEAVIRAHQERELIIHNLLVRIHFIIVMIRWIGLNSRCVQVRCVQELDAPDFAHEVSPPSNPIRYFHSTAPS